jgi:peptidoglycan/LPS O-acetylase OafA/YrhL
MVLKRDSPNLDILRSFAVIGVLVNHLAQITPRGRDGGEFALNAVGHAGVLIFFVHTALVLMGSLERLQARDGATGRLLMGFYIQRLFRIYPLSITCVTIVLLSHVAVPGLRLKWLTFKAIVANLALWQNLTGDPSVIPPLWSLPYEVQMYLVLPFIYLLAKRRGALMYLATLWIAAALSTVLFSPNHLYSESTLQCRLLCFVPTFLGGVFAFVLIRKRHANLPAALWPILLVAIFLVFQVFSVPRTEVVMSALGFAIPQFAEVENNAMRTIAHTVAKYSYGIYLMHVPLLEVCFIHLHSLGVPLRCILFITLLAICSVAGYHLIEKPMIDLGHRLSGRMTSNRGNPATLVRA